jgi:hypothetical protein
MIVGSDDLRLEQGFSSEYGYVAVFVEFSMLRDSWRCCACIKFILSLCIMNFEIKATK